MMRKEIKALINNPYWNLDPNTTKYSSFELPVPIIPIKGVMNAATNALIKSLKAPPTTIATAKSTTLPLRIKSRKPACQRRLPMIMVCLFDFA